MSNAPADPAALPNQPPYPIPPLALRDMVLTLPRPAPDAPATDWQGIVQVALDKLADLNPRGAIEAMLAIQYIALSAAALDACRLGFELGTTAVQARQQRASATALTRAMAGVLRMLDQHRAAPEAPTRDWGNTAEGLAQAWQAEPPRPTETAKPAAEEPKEIIRWLDEVPDDELAEEAERIRREEAGEPPLPVKPGPRRIYMHKPNDYALTWKPDERAQRKYPGWENMTKPERRAYFGYTYTGEGCPISMLTPESQAAREAGEE